MGVKTHGPIRGFVGRWMMRFEASGDVLRLGFQGTTAISALSGVLAYGGFGRYVPAVLAIGSLGIFAFAFSYVEFGIYSRKNRERQDRGRNWAKPQNRIDNEILARAILAGKKERALNDKERETIATETDAAYRQLRNGVDIDK